MSEKKILGALITGVAVGAGLVVGSNYLASNKAPYYQGKEAKIIPNSQRCDEAYPHNCRVKIQVDGGSFEVDTDDLEYR